MTTPNKYTISALLIKIRRCFDFDLTADFTKLSYKDFKAIMMLCEDVEPVITYERTIKEKYKLLQEFKFISKTELLDIKMMNRYLKGDSE